MFSRLFCPAFRYRQHGQEYPRPEDERNKPAPLYYILSEVGSEDMDSPTQKEKLLNSDENKETLSHDPREKRFRFANCFKRDSGPIKDEETASLERDHLILEYDELDSGPVKASLSFEISVTSAFSPVRSSEHTRASSYPTQARRDQDSHISLYPSTMKLQGQTICDGANREINDYDLMKFSTDHECVQLMVPSFGFDQAEERSTLGVAFPHPAVFNTNNLYHLGIQTDHPNWIEREKENVWDHVESYPLDHDDISAPPSPILVESTTANESWADDNSLVASKCRVFIETKKPELNEERGDTADTSIPAIWKSRVYDPIYNLAKDFSGCGRIDDVFTFDEAPFDEVEIDSTKRSNRSNKIPPHVLSDRIITPQPSFDDDSSYQTYQTAWVDYRPSLFPSNHNIPIHTVQG